MIISLCSFLQLLFTKTLFSLKLMTTTPSPLVSAAAIYLPNDYASTRNTFMCFPEVLLIILKIHTHSVSTLRRAAMYFSSISPMPNPCLNGHLLPKQWANGQMVISISDLTSAVFLQLRNQLNLKKNFSPKIPYLHSSLPDRGMVFVINSLPFII